MRREAHFVENEFIKGEWTDEVVYAILHREWLARRDPALAPAPAAREGHALLAQPARDDLGGSAQRR
jgi:hypothetical protein